MYKVFQNYERNLCECKKLKASQHHHPSLMATQAHVAVNVINPANRHVDTLNYYMSRNRED